MSAHEIADPRVADRTLAAVDDPDLQSPGETSLLDSLRDLAAPVQAEDVVFEVRTRPGWAVRYSIVIDADRLKKWSEAATSKNKTDEIRFACIVLANQCRGLIKDGVDQVDADSRPVTFAYPSLWEMYGVSRAADVVRAFYGLDTYLGATLDSLLREAGVGEHVAPLDPTQSS